MTFDTTALERRIDDEMRIHKVPGFALAVVEGDAITHAQGFGVTSVEDAGLAVSPDTLFCCGSISKTLTAATVMRLVDEGTLNLDSPVTEYLPWLTFSRHEFADGVTLRRLLSHSSGLFGTAGNFGPRDLTGLEAFIREAIPRLPFVAPPGTVFEYCSLGIDLAGYVAEVVGGKYFPDLVHELLLCPLGMTRTTYDRTVAMTYPVALPHQMADDGTVRVQHRMFDYAAANPAAQVMTSTRDLAKLATMALNQGVYAGQRVLSTAAMAEMLRPHVSLRDAEGSGYGLGLYTLRYNGCSWVTHGGALTPYLCEISLFPDHGIGVVFQCNITNEFNPSAIRSSIVDQLLDLPRVGPKPSAPPSEPQQEDLERHTGTYLSLAAGMIALRLDGDHLVLERGGQSIPLESRGDDLFVDPKSGAAVGIVPEKGGQTHYVMLDDHPYERVDLQSLPTPPVSVLTDYEGRFVDEEGDSIKLHVQGEELWAAFSWLGTDEPCIPLSASRFTTASGLIEMRTDARDKPVLAYMGHVIFS